MNKNVVYRPKLLLAHLIKEEKKRNSALKLRYKRALKALPRGQPYIRKKSGKGKAYVYLSRRMPGFKHPESKYVGVVGSDQVKKLHQQLKDRARLVAELNVLGLERRMIDKALYEYRRACRSYA